MPGIPQINILSSNYSRYGTSIYQTLYSNSEESCSTSSARGAANVSNKDGNSGNDGGTDFDNTNTKSKLKRKYKSLLQNYGGNSSSRAKKFIGKFHDHSPSDSFSLFSLRSSYSNRNLPTSHSRTAISSAGAQHEVISEYYRPYDDINSLPVEILGAVIEQFTPGACFEDSRTLVRCLYINKKFYAATKPELYKSPAFTSTYRVAQFVTSIRIHPENGLHVRHLNLSTLKNGIIEGHRCHAEHRCGFEQERISARRRTSARDVLEEADEDQSSDTEAGGATIERSESPIDEDLPDIALAGWRDWRYRFDPLYGNQMLSCHNVLRKVSSRPSSIHSTGTNSTSTASGGRRSHRSNSSVTSFTTSIISPFYNSPSLSSLSLIPSYDSSSGKKSGRWFNKLFSTRKTPKQQYEKYVETNFKNRKNIDELCNDAVRDNTNRAAVKFSVETNLKDQPFHDRHPMTNKFLLKYALSKDVPLGYLFHVVNHCPNIITLNLADLNISTDFKLHARTSQKWNHATSLLPDMHAPVSEDDALWGRNLEPLYFTDSAKGHGYYANPGGLMSKKLEDLHFVSPYAMVGESWISSHYPPPIDERTKIRGQRSRSQKQHDYTLTKVEVRDLFQLMYDKLGSLSTLHMDNVVWCNQSDVKEFVFSSLDRNPLLEVFFSHAGMGRNLSWASSGHVCQFVATLLLGEVLDHDDLYVEDLFNVRTERYNCDADHDCMILGRSNSVRVCTYSHKTITCRLQVRRGSHFTLETSIDSDSTVLCEFSLGPERQANDEGLARVEELAHQLVGRLESLRTAELRRHIGENQYTMH
ncbi:LAME_0H08108g1_1 [Lachancea meyersii CBS 8951]|uniref:LAME_0H08108g1_1 n=1 Tax=Lachancea meyersii CBS 8951 TaxID=1266667 RepID=A0A1G4KF16_9SACH|nr:LAME_0H08108g1_1 [Lachancea meyersii CBS 8951]